MFKNRFMTLTFLTRAAGIEHYDCSRVQRGNLHFLVAALRRELLDKDENLITTVLAVPNLRLRRTGKSVFAFWEIPAGQPKALRAWFYPGEEFGQEFACPKGEASSITSNNTGATVPTDVETYSGDC